MFKNNKRLIIILIIVIIVISISSIYSIIKFQVVNPFSSACGMLQILLTDKQYTIVQNYPQKVIFAKSGNSDNSLNEYMKERGFIEIPELQLGSGHTYSNGTLTENVVLSGNSYYSKWVWTK